MSNATTTINRTRRARIVPPCPARQPLVTKRQQRVFLLLGAMLLVGGFAAGLATMLRPAPLPQLVGMWILSDPSQHGQREAALERDRAALLDGGKFRHVSALPIGTPTLRQVQAQLAELQTLRPRESVVLYVAANATLDEQQRVQLPLGTATTRDSLLLRDVLVALRDSPARRKLLVLDLIRDDNDTIWPHPSGEVAAAIVTALDETADARRLCISSCSPGQSPHICEVEGRTLFGLCFAQALTGDADGAGDGRHDGRVSVTEVAAYVMGEVERLARATQAARQTPLIIGEGRDFDLTSVAIRTQRTDRGAKKPIVARAYPKWLAAAWANREQMSASGAFANSSRVKRRWDQTLLRAEGQWRGGRAAADVERDLALHLDGLQRELNQIDIAVAAPAPYSLAELRRSSTLKDFPAASQAVDGFMADLSAKTAGLPTDKAAVVRAGLVSDFLDKTQKLGANALAAAIVERLTTDDTLAADQIDLCDQLLRARQPQPRYVETLFVGRLAEAMAIDPTVSPDILVQALRVMQKGEQAALGSRSFAWSHADLTLAAQQRYDADYLLLRPGFAPPALVGESLTAAERGFERVAAANAAIDEAYRTLDEAMLRLPIEFNQLSPTTDARAAWLAAAQTACILADFLRLPRAATASERGDAADSIERARHLSLTTTAALDQLHRAASGLPLDTLVASAGRADASAETWSLLHRALASPSLSVADRLRLWEAQEKLNVKLYGSCVTRTAKGSDARNSFGDRETISSLSPVDVEKLECPRCGRTGKVKAKGTSGATTCPLCMGLGELPPLHAIVENETSLALYYWECSCEIKKYGMTLRYAHPSNHEVCEKCGAVAKDAPLSPAGYAQAFYAILYDLDMDIEYPSDKAE